MGSALAAAMPAVNRSRSKLPATVRVPPARDRNDFRTLRHAQFGFALGDNLGSLGAGHQDHLRFELIGQAELIDDLASRPAGAAFRWVGIEIDLATISVCFSASTVPISGLDVPVRMAIATGVPPTLTRFRPPVSPA